MNKLKQALLVLLAVLLLSVVSQGFAKEATPMVEDPEMEKVVNEISDELRCLVCQNQTIADSNAPLAVDLKNQVREMVKTGESQQAIIDYMVERYGNFVRYRPPMNASTMLLWVGPFLLLLIGLVVLVFNLRKRAKLVSNDGDLSAEETARLKSLLDASQQQEKENKS